MLMSLMNRPFGCHNIRILGQIGAYALSDIIPLIVILSHLYSILTGMIKTKLERLSELPSTASY